MNYATVNDLVEMWRQLTQEEQERAEHLIEAVSADLRLRAKRKDRDLDEEVQNDKDFALVVKSVVCTVVMRSINADTGSEAYTQMSQSANGYTVSMTPYNSQGGIFISRSEYEKLGLKGVQRYGAIDI